MSFMKKILHFMILILMRKKLFGLCSPPSSPCPDIFLYKYEENRWIGEIKIPTNKSVNHYELAVAYYLWSREEKFDGDLKRKDSKKDTVRNHENGRPITYTLILPLAAQPHWIKNITVNDQLVCQGKVQYRPVTIVGTTFDFYNIESTYSVGMDRDSVRSTTERPQPLFNRDKIDSSRRMYIITEDTDKCGLIPERKAATDIISNGEPVTRQPWLVALYEYSDKGFTFFCAGTLITSQFVVTAAHCTYDKKFIYLLLGSTDMSILHAPGSVFRQSTDFKSHHEYVKGSSNADIAIIKMSEPVDFTSTIQPVCMWPNRYLDEDQIRNHPAKVYGWGNDENGHLSTQLKATSQRIKSLTECKQMDLLRNVLSDKTICAAADDSRSGPCLGDSGGGLYFSSRNRTVIRGVISVAIAFEKRRTCDHNYFSVYTDVGKYFVWIQDSVNQM